MLAIYNWGDEMKWSVSEFAYSGLWGYLLFLSCLRCWCWGCNKKGECAGSAPRGRRGQHSFSFTAGSTDYTPRIAFNKRFVSCSHFDCTHLPLLVAATSCLSISYVSSQVCNAAETTISHGVEAET